MASNAEHIRIEILFNSVEVELDRRWAFGEVPSTFKDRPAEHLRRMVKAWWQIYHESAAAAKAQNRTAWRRNPANPAVALDTASLVDSLGQISKLINLDAIRAYRTVGSAELSAVCLLGMITTYYVEIRTQTPT
ncbi:hypothetical protein [Spirosoma arcticum]